MSAYINEDLISAHDGTNFEIIKETKTSIEDGETQYTISHLKYKSDVLHKFYNSLYTAKIKVGDCNDCGYDARCFNDVVWGDVLVLGLGLGVVPSYIKDVKGPTSVDVIEEDAEIVSTVVAYVFAPCNFLNVSLILLMFSIAKSTYSAFASLTMLDRLT